MAKKYVQSGVIQAYSKDEALDMLEELCDDGFIRNYYFNDTWRTLNELPKKVDGIIDMYTLTVSDKHNKNIRKYIDEDFNGKYYIFAAKL